MHAWYDIDYELSEQTDKGVSMQFQSSAVQCSAVQSSLSAVLLYNNASDNQPLNLRSAWRMMRGKLKDSDVIQINFDWGQVYNTDTNSCHRMMPSIGFTF